ncbi:hypothetical protein GCM10022226_21610 [Sphaerisporangium flaviroseum]|uniref:Protein kinase domain-containing protein n=1 Tax=Sphaerisporangium flaviroseum TaxID=509199 RepID=A0ABP7HQ39_9ACTN
MSTPTPADATASENPGRIGPYRVVKRLSASCCSVATYLAESPSGERVVVRHYADPPARRPADPSSWLDRLRQASTVGTAHVLDVGPDYVAGEHVDGPALPTEIQNRGPISGAALQRLAIATVTALAALHRAGIDHVGIRPSRVLLGPDGPRLAYPGPEHHDMSSSAHETNPLSAGALSWRAPEELEGHRPGPPADLFAWAAVMAYAATGRDPFDAGSITATIKRLSNAAANLGALEEGALRDLLTDCLVREPDQRPSAEDALLRLIGHSHVLETAVPDSVVAPRAAARPRSGLRRVVLPLAAGLVLALVAGGVSAAVTLRTAGDRRPATAPTSAGASWTPRAVPSGPLSPLPRGTAVTLPGGLGTVYEDPADPVRLGSIRVNDGSKDESSSASYARDPKTGAFEEVGLPNTLAELSPDGRWLATLDSLFLATSNQLDVAFTDHLTGARFTVPALRLPYVTFGFAWSRQSDSVVITAVKQEKGKGKDTNTVYAAGFVIIDVRARTSVFVPTSDAEEVKSAGSAIDPNSFLPLYRWAPDGRSVAARYVTANLTQGLRFRDLSGQPIRLMHWVGSPTGNGDWFSPSGELFATSGCGQTPVICVWRTATGQRVATIPATGGGSLIGWYDERHFIEVSREDGVHRVVARDFAGKVARVLAEVRAPASALVDVRYTRG